MRDSAEFSAPSFCTMAALPRPWSHATRPFTSFDKTPRRSPLNPPPQIRKHISRPYHAFVRHSDFVTDSDFGFRHSSFSSHPPNFRRSLLCPPELKSPPMDPQIAFPNPIARTDLPAPRRRWRYVLAGAIFILALITILLPQIASSKIGRSALKMYLEGKYRGSAWVGDVNTSWFGSTTINGFSLMDPEGRSIKFARLDCQTPFRKLLTGNY